MTQHPVLLSADTPCDIGNALKERYRVSLFPLHILLDGKQYTDGLDITPDEIYAAWRTKRALPRTAAINPEEYISYFTPFLAQGYDVLHISLGSGLSSCYQNAKLAAEKLATVGNVRVVDSCSLSAGAGILVCEAGERIAAGLPLDEIERELIPLVEKTSASFVLDTLEFMHAGGRCSGVVHLSADMLSIKPAIVVKNDRQGSMVVGKKYIGKLDRALMKYTEEQLKGRTDIVLDRVFITHSTIDPALVEKVKEKVLSYQPFREVFDTDASCTIGAHCGPGTLGVLFLTK